MIVRAPLRGTVRQSRIAADERGITIIEVVVAGLILIVSSIAVLGIVEAATRNDYRAEQSQVVNDVLQRELENIKQLPYEQVALIGQPPVAADANDPDSRVTATRTQFNIRRSGSSVRDLVYNGGVSQKPGVDAVSEGVIPVTDPTAPTDSGEFPSRFTSGDVRGTIYRFVVWDRCSDSTLPCTGYLKRVIVAVKLDSTASGGARPYQEIQGQVMDPQAQPPENPTCEPTDPSCNITPWKFWLTDTPCGGADERQDTVPGEILDTHRTHNTRGVCDAETPSQPTFDNNPGAPDLMINHAPLASTDERPLSDFSTDVEPGCGTTDCFSPDKGLQLLESSSCNSVTGVFDVSQIPDTNGQTFQKAHKWLSPPIPSGFPGSVILTGDGTLYLWTRAITDDTTVMHPGQICVFLFTRQAGVTGVPVDLPAVNLDLNNVNYFTYQDADWPTGGWQEIAVPLHFDLAVDLTPGTRLGMALSVDPSSDDGGLEFVYDEPSFESQLVVQTTGTLPF